MSSFSRNVPLLALAQAMMMSGNSLIVSVSALTGYTLAINKSLATLPLATQFIATMLVSIPAALTMERIGRRKGFMAASLIGICGALVASIAIINAHFWLFVLAAMMIGTFNGFAIYYRFTAADSVASVQKARAISWVMTGGVIAALIGPNLARFTRDSLADSPFAGSFAGLSLLYLVGLLAVFFISLPPKPEDEFENTGRAPRPLGQIAKQSVFIVALICGMLGYGVMSLVMTATPLAMQHHQHLFDDTAFVIQWHVLGMFAPSFFTGHLIARFGLINIMLTGAVSGLICVATNLLGSTVWHFWLALLLLGVSWNFLFIGATTMLTQTYRATERAKTQALNDFLVFSTVAVSSLSAGYLQHRFGWQAVNIGVIPLLLIVLTSLVWLRLTNHSR